ncbi:MAG: PilZ domain-containing protein [Candidatus Omnitrophota bacterium]|nr:PilZ domain-containing protein [Candidatus Omnitrophota bacterium]
MWGGINRRKFPRANYPCVISVKRKDQPDGLSTQTENLGIGGICVILPRDLGIFAPVEISLDLLDGQLSIERDGTVAWVIASKEDKKKESFDTGLEFTNLKRKDAIRINSIVEKVVETQ